jgi:hypothetical protein
MWKEFWERWSPEYSIADDIGFVRGSTFSLQVMMPQMMAFDLTKFGPDFRERFSSLKEGWIPTAPGSVIADYMKTIHAPQKEIVWFENSGHFPFYEERQKFTEELVQRVLPIAADPTVFWGTPPADHVEGGHLHPLVLLPSSTTGRDKCRRSPGCANGPAALTVEESREGIVVTFASTPSAVRRTEVRRTGPIVVFSQ